MIFKKATNQDIDGIINIWKACFTDDIDYINNYIKYCFPYCKTFIALTDNNEVASSITLIPTYAIIQGALNNNNTKELKGYYLYAVGTLPQFRGNAISLRLINYAIELCKNERVSFIITRPSNDSLYAFYNKLGFSHTLYEEHLTIDIYATINTFSSKIQLQNLSADKLYKLRLSRKKDTIQEIPENYFKWPTDILNYAIIEVEERKGICSLINIDPSKKDCGYFLSYPEETFPKTIKVLETNINEKHYNLLCDVIHCKYPQAEQIKIIRPSTSQSRNLNIRKSGLLLLLDKEVSSDLLNYSILLPLE